MAKRKVKSPEELEQTRLQSDLKEAEKTIKLGTIPLNPTRVFTPGDQVRFGGHKETYIQEKILNGLYYIVKCLNDRKEGNTIIALPSVLHCVPWHELHPYRDTDGTSQFRQEDDLYIRQLNGCVDSLLHMVYGGHAGVDFDVDYQREHVWTLEDKTALIDSIYNNVDIGKFLFAQRSESHPGKYYEIIDGKQRLTALCEFYEDRYQYKGYYYSQLSFMDQYKFRNHGVVYGYLENPTLAKIYKSFIKLNTCGKPMEHKHIEKVQKLLDDLK